MKFSTSIIVGLVATTQLTTAAPAPLFSAKTRAHAWALCIAGGVTCGLGANVVKKIQDGEPLLVADYTVIATAIGVNAQFIEGVIADKDGQKKLVELIKGVGSTVKTVGCAAGKKCADTYNKVTGKTGANQDDPEIGSGQSGSSVPVLPLPQLGQPFDAGGGTTAGTTGAESSNPQTVQPTSAGKTLTRVDSGTQTINTVDSGTQTKGKSREKQQKKAV